MSTDEVDTEDIDEEEQIEFKDKLGDDELDWIMCHQNIRRPIMMLLVKINTFSI